MLPVSSVDFAIWPLHGACTVFFVALEITFIDAAIFPCEYTKTMHTVVVPIPFIMFTISPIVSSLALHQVLDPTYIVSRSIWECPHASTILFAIFKQTFILGTIRKSFNTLTMTKTFHPI